MSENRLELLAAYQRDARAHAQAARLSDPARVIYMLGLHLSQVTGTSALAVVSQRLNGDAVLSRVEGVETFKGTPYQDIVLRVKEVMTAACPCPELRGLCVDLSTTGGAIGEVFDAADLPYVPYVIAESERSEAGCVSLKDLVGVLQRLVQGGRFQIRSDAPGVDGLLKELRAFEVAVDGQRKATFRAGAMTPARVLAIGLATWDCYWFQHMLWPEIDELPAQRAARARFSEGY